MGDKATMMKSKDALQTLAAISEFASDTSKYAKSLLQKLPQPCREFVDAPRAFAVVHLDAEFLGEEAGMAANASKRESAAAGGYGGGGAGAASGAASKLATGAASVLSGW